MSCEYIFNQCFTLFSLQGKKLKRSFFLPRKSCGPVQVTWLLGKTMDITLLPVKSIPNPLKTTTTYISETITNRSITSLLAVNCPTCMSPLYPHPLRVLCFRIYPCTPYIPLLCLLRRADCPLLPLHLTCPFH